MKFSEFAHLIHPIVDGSANQHTFAKTILDAIIRDDGKSILEEYSQETFKSYYNGNTAITKLAKKITTSIEPMLFEEYLEPLPDQSVQKLCDIFESRIEGIDQHNALEKLSVFYADILYDAAGERRKTKKEEVFTEAEATPIDREQVTIIRQQTNVVMQGENNFNLTNNGVMNFDFSGD